MTAISVGVGSAMGAIDGPFFWFPFLLALASAVMLHAGTNLINDYYDVGSGVDTVESATAQYRPHPLVEGRLPAEQVKWAAYALFAMAAVIGIYLVATRGQAIFWIGLAGLVAGLTYTAPPLRYKYVALGELSVFLMWGPLMVEGSYYVQRQVLSPKAFWVSLPFGLLVALVLLANNIRDIELDQSRRIHTLATVLGKRRGLTAYLLLMALAYVGIIALAGFLTPWLLIILTSLPLAFRLFRQMAREVPMDADARTAQLDTAFGLLLVAALIMEGILR
ncbi:MAG: 1,4-dihydroxy-2-naphthoate octaprenyltransferase [Desulfobacterales bacterium]|nr:1,4-dihydroxy-2-naphthoate octaprenyltransferase [Desulfobacterales bacterium]